MKTLRTYQEAGVKALFNWLFTPDTGDPLVVMPVGAGKSLTIAEFIKRVHASHPETKIVVLAHVKELLVQNAEELISQYPDANMGFYCAGLGKKHLHHDITFASIQSVAKKADKFPRVPQIIIVDECHLISTKESTQYQSFFSAIRNVNPKAKRTADIACDLPYDARQHE